jgi:hypothetical protein
MSARSRGPAGRPRRLRPVPFLRRHRVWSLCLRRAGWPDDRPVWTGSCPCGPFSVAGQAKGFDDPRHLWPEWFRLIGERRPDVLFGEQSDAADAWIDLVSADLEGTATPSGRLIFRLRASAAPYPPAVYFVADADNAEWWSERAPWHDGDWPKTGRVQGDGHAGDGGADGWMADTRAIMDGRRTQLVVGPDPEPYTTADRAHAERVLAEVQGLSPAYRDARIETEDGEAEANARIIDAAPELLDALEDLLAACGGDQGGDPEWAWQERQNARAAIAKAVGTSEPAGSGSTSAPQGNSGRTL